MRPRGRAFRRATLTTLAVSLVLSSAVQAKGPTSAEVCGANGCQELHRLQLSPELSALFTAQAGPDPPPTEASGWFDITMRFGHVRERFALLQDPDYIRAVGKREGIVAPGEQDREYGWLRLSPAEAEAHERLTEGLEPLPISDLPRLQATAPDLAAAVRAADTAGGGGMHTAWLVVGGAFGVAASAALLLVRRRARSAAAPTC
jgi:hypothetical protein